MNPIGAGESRRLPAGEIASLKAVSWFPDGKHLLLTGAATGQPLRTYEMDTEGAKPQALGPTDFIGAVVAPDGKRIAGRNAAGEAVVFNRESEKMEVIPGVDPQDQFSKWTEDGRALITYSSTPSAARTKRRGRDFGALPQARRARLPGRGDRHRRAEARRRSSASA